MTDAGLLLTIALAACVVVPWLICRSFPVAQNMSRAPRPSFRKPIDDAWEDRAYGDVPALPDLNLLHAASSEPKGQRNNV